MTKEHSIFELHKLGALPETAQVLRGTGIKDKDGKEIFEGDVLRGDNYPFHHNEEENYVGIMEWVFNSWQIVSRQVSDRVNGSSHGINSHVENEKLESFAVIGNIYENPEYDWDD